MEEQVPRQTMIYKLHTDVYDEFIARLEEPRGDMEKTEKLFQRPSPFVKDCE